MKLYINVRKTISIQPRKRDRRLWGGRGEGGGKQELTNELTKELTNELTNELTQELTNELTKELTNEFTNELTKELTNELTNELTKELTNELTKELTNELTNDPHPFSSAPLPPSPLPQKTKCKNRVFYCRFARKGV